MARFEKGTSGNPTGRPKGRPDKRTKLRELLEPHAEALIQQAVTMALDGDNGALKLCLDRLLPPYRPTSEPVALNMPVGTLTQQASTIMSAVTAGEITTEEGAALVGMLANAARVQEADAKLHQLEELKKLIAALSR